MQPDRDITILLPRLLADIKRPGDFGAGAFDSSETEAIVAALGRVRESDASDIIAAVARRWATARWAPVTRLLREAASARPGAYLSTAAQVVFAAMGAVDEVPSGEGREGTDRGKGLADLVHAIGSIGVLDLGAELARVALANPARWPFDGVIVPAVLALPRSDSGGLPGRRRPPSRGLPRAPSSPHRVAPRPTCRRGATEG